MENSQSFSLLYMLPLYSFLTFNINHFVIIFKFRECQPFPLGTTYVSQQKTFNLTGLPIGYILFLVCVYTNINYT